jgi:hypothetical protein
MEKKLSELVVYICDICSVTLCIWCYLDIYMSIYV